MVKRNYIHAKRVRCFTNPCLNFSGGLIKLMLRASVSKYNSNETFDVITYPCHNLSKIYHRGNKRIKLPVGPPLLLYQCFCIMSSNETQTPTTVSKDILIRKICTDILENLFTIFSIKISRSWFDVKTHLFWHRLWFGVYDIHWFGLVYFWHGQTWQNDSLDAFVWKKQFLFYWIHGCRAISKTF